MLWNARSCCAIHLRIMLLGLAGLFLFMVNQFYCFQKEERFIWNLSFTFLSSGKDASTTLLYFYPLVFRQ